MITGYLVGVYILITIMIGIYSARFVSSSKDYCLAGRNLSFLLCSSTMFSTWFGSETIIGASSEFVQHGILGVIEDPFGTSLCFMLIGVFFARKIYSLNVMTIIDFYRIKFGVKVEVISSVFMILSYLGWIAAQFLAMAIVLNVVLGLPVAFGVILSMLTVCLFTIFGGMWSISINDFIQTVMIIVGLVALAIFVTNEKNFLQQIPVALPDKFFNILPEFKIHSYAQYIAAWLTIGLGSIPQQDVFQRVMSAKSADTAEKASYMSAAMYITLAAIPLYLAMVYKLSDPALANMAPDRLLLQAILQEEHPLIEVLFFGALLSAIMSSASGAILAPATILGENLFKPYYKFASDKAYLRVLKLSVLLISIVSCGYALVSGNVYYLVAESSVVSLVSLFVPFTAGLYWKKASSLGALLSISFGPIVWLICVYAKVPIYGVLLGLLASIMGMVFGSVYTRST